MSQPPAPHSMPFLSGNTQTNISIASTGIIYGVQWPQDVGIWYTDGDLVLVAQQQMAFRIYQNLLSKYSKTFCNFLAGPLFVDQVYGCPVVHVQTSPSDMRFLLQVLTETNSKGEPQFNLAGAIVITRLSHQYEIEYVRERCLNRVKSFFPDDFDEWDHYSQNRKPSMQLAAGEAIAVVNLAHTIQERTLLPVALYFCCMLTAQQLTGGVLRPDGMVDRLSLEDVNRCIDAKPLIAHKSAMVLLQVLSEASPDCARGPLCAHAMNDVLHHSVQYLELQHTALANSESEINQMCGMKGICDECNEFMRWKSYEYRWRIWRELPSFFGLNPWWQLSAWEP